MNGYSVEIVECSKELKSRDRVKLKSLDNVVKINDAVKTEPALEINVDYFATLAVHNEFSANKDYSVHVLVDKDGTTYATSSKSFMDAFSGIYEEVKDDGEDIIVRVVSHPSKNFSGDFLTCQLV